MKRDSLARPTILLAILAAIFMLTPRSAHAQDITGDWQASLKQGFSQFRLALHIERNANGPYHASLDDIDGGLANLPTTSIRRSRANLTFNVYALGASYSGTINFPATEIKGTWTQDNESVPLDFTRPDGPMIITQYPFSSDPINVSDFKEGNDPVTPGVPIKAGDDWLKNISLTIKNVSPKNITRVEVRLLFLDTGNGTRERPFSGAAAVEMGLRPEHDLYTHSGQKITQTPGPPLLLPPGQRLTVSFGPHYDEIKQDAEARQPMSTIQKVLLSYDIFFADGTTWVAGEYYRPDPEVHRRYLPISFSEFKQYSPPQ